MYATVQNMNRHAKILLVEDNRNDAFLLREVLKHIRRPALVDTVPDGAEALQYLNHEGMYKSIELPDVILLDLGLPKVSGWEVLQAVKTNPKTENIPVLIISGSWRAEVGLGIQEFKNTYYMIKPLFLTEFPMLVRTLNEIL